MLDMLSGHAGLVLLILFALFALSRIALNVQSFPWGRRKKETYEWQPDLSHNLLRSDWPGSEHNNMEMNINLVAKSQEQRDEERRAYLREKEK